MWSLSAIFFSSFLLFFFSSFHCERECERERECVGDNVD